MLRHGDCGFTHPFRGAWWCGCKAQAAMPTVSTANQPLVWLARPLRKRATFALHQGTVAGAF